jgi:tight adherence protein B
MLGELLSAPELWLGLGALLVMVFVFGGNGKSAKKLEERLTRVTQPASAMARTSTISVQSLRRQVAGSETAFGQVLGSMQSIARLRARLEVAGMESTSPQKFIGIMVGIACVVALLMYLVFAKPWFVCLPVGILFGLALPHLKVSRRIKKRQNVFLKTFPDAIELMVRGLRAGLPIGESFITVSKEIPPPVGSVFASIAQMAQLGVPVEKALLEAANKLGLTEFNFFVTTVILQRETGGNLGEILNNLADMLRQRSMMRMKITALCSEARASAYIIGALPFVVFAILQVISPDYVAPLFSDARGTKALLMAGGSLTLGALIMKRMTQLEI